jgi:hypothetical protein
MFRKAQYSPCNTSPDCSFLDIAKADSVLALIDLPSSEVALDPILISEKQHRFVPLAAQTYRDGTDACRLPAWFAKLDGTMFRGPQRDEVCVGHRLWGAALDQQVHLSSELAGR